MTTTHPDPHPRRLIFVLWVFGFALLYALGFFQGLEHHSSWLGNSFKAIHPESFPGDRFVTGSQPTMLSLTYVLAHVVGELWLDDRFQFVLYLGLVVLGLWAVDRLVRLMGIAGRMERLTIMALLLVSHHLKANVFSQFVPSSGSPTAYIHPLGLWLSVLILQANRAGASLALSALMVGVAVKNAWYPAMASVFFAVRDRWQMSWKRLAVGTAVGLGGIFLIVVLAHQGNREAPVLFDWVNWFEKGEANPFSEPGVGNYFYVLLLIGAMVVPYPTIEIRQRCRAFFAIALIALVMGGFYYTYAPDALKIPLLQALSLNRTAWWPQQLSYLILGCYALKLFDRPARRAKVFAVILLGALYLLPVFEPGTLQIDAFFVKRAWLLLAVGAVVYGVFLATRVVHSLQRPWIGRALTAKAAVLMLPVVLATTGYLVRCTYTQGPHLRFLMTHGVMGNSAGARWVGVNEYMRTKTPATASVLALAVDQNADLQVNWTLRARTGRTMPVGHRTIAYLSYEKASWYFEQLQVWHALIRSWEQHDWVGVSTQLANMGSPDYLVVPTDRTEWLQGVDGLPYVTEAVIGDSTIFRSTAARSRTASLAR